MSITTQIERILADRNTIRSKLVELGMASSVDNLDKLAAAMESLINRGAVRVEVKEGETYTIPAGYHNGTGTVAGIAGGGNYTLQSKTVVPTKLQQAVTSDEGYYGLSGVTVAAIPEVFQDVTAVTAEADNVLVGKVFVSSTGAVIAGTMTNNNGVEQVIDISAPVYTVPKGYHDGTGKVEIVVETKTVTPTKSTQNVTPSSGKVLSKVVVNPIPAAYQDVTPVTAAAADVLDGKKIVDDKGNVVEGTMPAIEGILTTLDTVTEYYNIPAGYHDGGGFVTINVNEHSVTPTKEEQVVEPEPGFVISKVTVGPIPAAYQNVSRVNATVGDVLAGVLFVDSAGNEQYGSMTNCGTVSEVLTPSKSGYVIPQGYHSGKGAVYIETEVKSVTPTKETQSVVPSTGKVLSLVNVRAIPDAYQDVSSVDAGASHVLSGKKIVTSDGAIVTGTMTNNGAITASIDGMSTTSYTIPAGYHNGSGKVALTSDIENALSEI